MRQATYRHLRRCGLGELEESGGDAPVVTYTIVGSAVRPLLGQEQTKGPLDGPSESLADDQCGKHQHDGSDRCDVAAGEGLDGQRNGECDKRDDEAGEEAHPAMETIVARQSIVIVLRYCAPALRLAWL